MLWLIIFDCFLLAIGGILGVYRLQRSREIVKKAPSTVNHGESKDEYKDIVIIIPVYNEQAVIRNYFMNFLPFMRKGIEVIYVGTNKEKGEIKTYDILNELVNEFDIQDYCKIMLYPNSDGVMAHQINYALRQIEDEKIVGVYNVDSFIGIQTIDYVLKNKDKLKNGVFQQYSYSICSGKGMIRNGVMWQNRWSLAYELPRAARQYEFGIKKFNYTIGHGLFFSNKTINDIGLFSESHINEDNVLGYELSNNNIRIYPIPFLEKIDFAHNLPVYVKQQSVWFNGPLYAFNYFIDKKNERKNLIKQFITSCQNFKNALNWFAFELLTFILLVYLGISGNLVWFAILLAETLFYVICPNIIAEKILYENGYINQKERKGIRYVIREVVFWLLIHSAGPIITFGRILGRKNSQKNKYKTEKVVE